MERKKTLDSSIFHRTPLLKNGKFGFNLSNSKEAISKDFGVEPSRFTLYRINHLEEPAFALRREKSEITKSHVGSGDLLILKSDAEISAEDKLSLNIHMTMTG